MHILNLVTKEKKYFEWSDSLTIKSIRETLKQHWNADNLLLYIDDVLLSDKDELKKPFKEYESVKEMKDGCFTCMTINYKSVVFSQTAVGSWNGGLLKLLTAKTMAELRTQQTEVNVAT